MLADIKSVILRLYKQSRAHDWINHCVDIMNKAASNCWDSCMNKRSNRLFPYNYPGAGIHNCAGSCSIRFPFDISRIWLFAYAIEYDDSVDYVGRPTDQIKWIFNGICHGWLLSITRDSIGFI